MDGDIRTVKVGSRKSQLALVQTHTIVELLSALYPNVNFEVVTMTTKGDQILDEPLSKIGEKSLFTKELEIALEDLKVDFVVHSLKDLPSTLPPGMAIGAIVQRDSPYDCVIFSNSKYKGRKMTLSDLPEGAVIGTSSLRRISQLKRAFPKLKFADVRGNLNTRLRKLDDENGIYDALILAEAGLDRLGWESRVGQVLPTDICMYAISQGAMAVECRSFDLETLQLLSPLNHKSTVLRCLAERALLRTLEGGCSVPIAVASEISEDNVSLTLQSGVFSLDGSEAIILSESSKLQIDVPNGSAEEDDEPLNKKQRGGHCPFSEAAQGHQVNPNDITNKYLAVKKQSCPYFSGILVRTIPHDVLEAAEQVGINLANRLKQAGGDEILKKARAENDKLKAIMDEEKRLKLENEKRLLNIYNQVAKAADSTSLSSAVVRRIVEDNAKDLSATDSNGADLVVS